MFLLDLLKTPVGKWAAGAVVGLVGFALPLYIYFAHMDRERLSALSARDKCLLDEGQCLERVSHQNDAIVALQHAAAEAKARADLAAVRTANSNPSQIEDFNLWLQDLLSH